MSERERQFRELIKRNLPRWAGIARCYAADSDREDLVQEIALQVWRSLDGFSQRSQIDTWAYRVALNTALAWNRVAKRHKAHFTNGHGGLAALVGKAPDESSERRILDEFLASLGYVDRALMLLYLENLPNEEAAKILGLTEGAVRVRMHRLRKKFEDAYCDKEHQR